MRRLVLLFAVFTVGCDDFATADITQTPYGSDNLRCRNGLMPASFGDLYIDQLALDGLGYYPNFEPNAVYGDEPSACISEDGTAAGFVIELDGEEAGYLYIQVDDVGAWSLADGSGDAVVELSLDTGSTSYALTSDDFTDGVDDVLTARGARPPSVLTAPTRQQARERDQGKAPSGR